MYPRDDFAEMEREDRTAKELATLRAEHDRYLVALVQIKEKSIECEAPAFCAHCVAREALEQK